MFAKPAVQAGNMSEPEPEHTNYGHKHAERNICIGASQAHYAEDQDHTVKYSNALALCKNAACWQWRKTCHDAVIKYAV